MRWDNYAGYLSTDSHTNEGNNGQVIHRLHGYCTHEKLSSPCNCVLTRGAAEHTGVLTARLVPASLHTADLTSDASDPGRYSRHLHCGLGWAGPLLQENLLS